MTEIRTSEALERPAIDPLTMLERLGLHLAAKYPQDRDVWGPHVQNVRRALRLREELATLQRAEEIALEHNQRKLADDLYGLGCYLGSRGVS